jgi:H+/Cl- antiporter ClcA
MSSSESTDDGLGTPVSGALFGIEVLYLGRIDYGVIFPALVAGIVGHLACGVRPPFPAFQAALADTSQVTTILKTLGAGALFFVGATSGAALAPLFGVPATFLGAVDLVAVLAAAANTPIAAAVMAMELLPAPEGVYAGLAASTAFLMVGHRSVYASQKLGLSKSAELDIELGGPIGEVTRSSVRIRKGSLTERVHTWTVRETTSEDKN